MKFDFFEILYNDTDFCTAMGKMTLAAGRFESDLNEYLSLFGEKVPEEKATLGSLISKLSKTGLINKSSERVFKDLKKQRNYLTHNLYNLFSERIEETILPRADLIPEDVSNFTEKANDLEYNFIALSKSIEMKISNLVSGIIKIDSRPLI